MTSSKIRDLAPSEVREIILQEHRELRARLAKLQAAVTGNDGLPIRKGLEDFADIFLCHIEKEDQILRPVIRDLDSWGEVRVERMNQEHAEQRKRLAEMTKSLGSSTPAQILKLATDFIAEIHADIEREERDLLNPDVLKDDPITAGNICG